MFELKNILVRTWVLIVFICLWEILVYFKIWSPALIASPHDTLIDLISLIADGQLWMHLSTSLSRIFWGALSGTIIGSVFGLLLGTFKNFKLQLSLIISIIYSIPPLALIPFFIIAFGIGEFTKIALIFITFFIISSLHASDGILQTHQNFIHLADLYEKSYLTKILDIWLP